MTLPTIEVVAAVLRDAAGRVLITRRPPGKALAGRWEFPGGKREPGEAPWAALVRELDEELGLHPLGGTPLFTLQHDYPERRVRMQTWQVTAWRGEPADREGQGLAWVAPDDLPAWDILEADAPIVAALRLPDRLLVTPEPGADAEAWLERLAAAVRAGQRLVQLRAPDLDAAGYAALARRAVPLVQALGGRILLNAEPGLARALGADGVHLSAARLARTTARPEGLAWVGASVHDAPEIAQAAALGVDFMVLGAVRATASHPAAPIGWARFATLAADAGRAVYAIGGLGAADIARAHAAGAHGVAAVRGFWPA